MLQVLTICSLVLTVSGNALSALTSLTGSGGSTGGLPDLSKLTSLAGSGGATGGLPDLSKLTGAGGSGLQINELAKSLGFASVDEILGGFTDDLKKNFNLVDLFPELKTLLGSDPFGALPVSSITADSSINSAKDLFKAPLADPVPEEPVVSSEKLTSCSAELKEAAKAFKAKYPGAKGGRFIDGPVNRQLNGATVECRRVSALSASKRRVNEAQFNAGLNAQSWELASLAKKLDLPLSTASSDKTESLLDGIFAKKTDGAVDDFGQAIVGDARAVCRRLTDAELPISGCEDRAEALCEVAKSIRDFTAESSFTTQSQVWKAVQQFQPKPSPRTVRRPAGGQTSAQSCRCAGDTLRAAVQESGNDRRADNCVAALQTKLEADRAGGAVGTLSEQFIGAQRAGADVSFEQLMRPEQLQVSNLAGKVLLPDQLQIGSAIEGLVNILGKSSN